MFAFDGTVLSAMYWMTVYKWCRQEKGEKAGKSSFYFNLMYLPAILFLMTIHSKRWKYKKGEFWSTHLAYLQDRGIEHCLFGGVEHYESSELPPYTSVSRDCLKIKDDSTCIHMEHAVNANQADYALSIFQFENVRIFSNELSMMTDHRCSLSLFFVDKLLPLFSCSNIH